MFRRRRSQAFGNGVVVRGRDCTTTDPRDYKQGGPNVLWRTRQWVMGLQCNQWWHMSDQADSLHQSVRWNKSSQVKSRHSNREHRMRLRSRSVILTHGVWKSLNEHLPVKEPVKYDHTPPPQILPSFINYLFSFFPNPSFFTSLLHYIILFISPFSIPHTFFFYLSFYCVSHIIVLFPPFPLNPAIF